MKIFFGLRSEIVTSLTILMVAFMILIGMGVLISNEREMVRQKAESGKIIAQGIQKNLGEFNVARLARADDLDFVVASYRDIPGVQSVALVDRTGVVLAHTDRNRVGTPLEEDLARTAMSLGRPFTRVAGRRHFLDLGEAVELYIPLTNERGGAIGCTQIVILMADLAGRIIPTRYFILIFVVFLSACLVIFGTMFLSRIIVTPLKNLVKTMERVSRGDLDQSIAVRADNEIGQLTDAFNNMTLRLKKNQEDLQHNLAALEQTNRELERSQAEVIQAVKLASIGRLAAGVAHEVGNPLSAVMGYIGILQQGVEGRGEEMDILNRMARETQRIDRIIRELLDYSRPSKGNIAEHNINDVIRRAISMLSHQKIMENIEIVLNLADDLPEVLIDEDKIQQVIVNLVINARDAMPSGGIMTLSTREDTFQRPPEQGAIPSRRREDPPGSDFTRLRKLPLLTYNVSRLTEGEAVIAITVADTGEGIDREDLGKIFDPFFTTKDPGKGTGLGLAVAMRIIEFFGGQLRIDSQKGKGTTAEIMLPST